MQSMLRRLVLGLGVACVTGLVFALVLAAGLGTAAAITAGALVGGAAAAVAATPAPSRPVGTSAVAGTAVRAEAGEHVDPLSQLRHDLRGVLSPALLTADRLLASSDDPAARRAAETMIETVERATALLAAPRPSAPGGSR